jgi:hypothetical protein
VLRGGVREGQGCDEVTRDEVTRDEVTRADVHEGSAWEAHAGMVGPSLIAKTDDDRLPTLNSHQSDTALPW